MQKEWAIAAVAQAAGVASVDIHSGDYTELFAAAEIVGLPRNDDMKFRPATEIAGAVWHSGIVAEPRKFNAVDRLGSRRAGPGHEFAGGGPFAASSLDMLELPGGTVMRLAGAAIVVAADGVSVTGEVSSEYARLLHVYDVDAAGLLAEARHVPGTAFVLMSDIGDGNYCHWLIDELPRLALLCHRTDVTIVIADVPVPWRRDLLDILGIAPERIVMLGSHEALRADILLVPNATRDMQHPARKGAAWVFDWLGSHVGLPALARCVPAAPTRRLYVGRGDATGRRLLNETALLRVLEPAGFVSVTLAGKSVAEQVGLFAGAEAIIGLHGAGLTNLVFCAAATSVVEIFTPGFGNPCFGLISAANGLRHATYCAEPGRMPPDGSHDCVLDVPAFWRAVEPWFRADRR